MSRHRCRSAFVACGLLVSALAPGAALAQAQRDPTPPPAIAAEFREFMTGFRRAVQANDRSAVAGLTRFPMLHTSDQHDRAAFEGRVYRQVFTPRNRTCLQTARPLYDRNGQEDGYYVVFCGDISFIFTKKNDGFRFAETGVND